MSPLIAKGEFVGSSGIHVQVLWRARDLDGDGRSWRQLKYILDSAYAGKRKYTHLIVKDTRTSAWEPAWAKIGVQADHAFRGSLRSALAAIRFGGGQLG